MLSPAPASCNSHADGYLASLFVICLFVGQILPMQPRLALSSQQSCVSLPSAGDTSTHHHAWLTSYWKTAHSHQILNVETLFLYVNLLPTHPQYFASCHNLSSWSFLLPKFTEAQAHHTQCWNSAPTEGAKSPSTQKAPVQDVLSGYPEQVRLFMVYFSH